MIEARSAWVETRSRRSRSGVTVPAELLDKVPDRRRRLLFLRAVADVLIRRLGFSLAAIIVILVRTVFGVFLRLVTVFSHCRRRRRDSSLLLLGLRFLRGRRCRRRLRGARTDTPTPTGRSRRPTATALPSSLLLQRVSIRAHFDARPARRSRVGGDFSSSSLDGRAELRRSVRGRRFGLLRGPLNIRLRGARRDFLLLLPRVIVVVVVLVVLVFSLLRMTVLDPVVVMVVVAVVMPVREVLLLVTSIAVRLLDRRTFFLVVLFVFLLLIFVVLVVLFDVAGSANSSRNRSRSVERLRGGDCALW